MNWSGVEAFESKAGRSQEGNAEKLAAARAAHSPESIRELSNGTPVLVRHDRPAGWHRAHVINRMNDGTVELLFWVKDTKWTPVCTLDQIKTKVAYEQALAHAK